MCQCHCHCQMHWVNQVLPQFHGAPPTPQSELVSPQLLNTWDLFSDLPLLLPFLDFSFFLLLQTATGFSSSIRCMPPLHGVGPVTHCKPLPSSFCAVDHFLHRLPCLSLCFQFSSSFSIIHIFCSACFHLLFFNSSNRSGSICQQFVTFLLRLLPLDFLTLHSGFCPLPLYFAHCGLSIW